MQDGHYLFTASQFYSQQVIDYINPNQGGSFFRRTPIEQIDQLDSLRRYRLHLVLVVVVVGSTVPTFLIAIPPFSIGEATLSYHSCINGHLLLNSFSSYTP